MNENDIYENEIYQDSKNYVKVLSIWILCGIICIGWIITSVYGGYKLITKNSDKAYLTQLELTIVRTVAQVEERNYKIKKLQEDIKKLKIAMNYEKLFLLVAKPDSIMLLGDLEKQIKDRAEFCLKPLNLEGG